MERDTDSRSLTSSGTRTVFVSAEVEVLTTPKLAIEVIRGPAKGTETIVDKPVFRCGSAQDNDLVIDDPTVSRHHIRLEIDSLGFRVKDLDSKNGLIMDGIRIHDAWITDSCKLVIGESGLRVKPIRENIELELVRNSRLGDMIGSGPQMRHFFALVQRVARTDSTVLIEAESGTGKELAARAIHSLSRRSGGPFEIFDCSAVPESLVESELFGHVKGAFTGATSTRKGLAEASEGGTLFIDEIGELPLSIQGKILRLIERHEMRPVGSDTFRSVDTRIIAATNRTLKDEVSAGRFREDLYYRLNVIRLRIPPLRERTEDIPLLVDHFIEEFSRRDNRHYSVSHGMLNKLERYDFPGNVRELRNLIENSCLLSDSVDIEVDIPGTGNVSPFAESDMSAYLNMQYKDAKDRLVSLFERTYWERLLQSCSGNITEASRRGGIHRKSLEYLLKKFRNESGDAN